MSASVRSADRPGDHRFHGGVLGSAGEAEQPHRKNALGGEDGT
jgi:hypothetical protein